MDISLLFRAENLALAGGLLTCMLVWAEWQRLEQTWKNEERTESFLGDQ